MRQHTTTRRMIAVGCLVVLTAGLVGITGPGGPAVSAAPAAPGAGCAQWVRRFDPATQQVRLVCVRRTEGPAQPPPDDENDENDESGEASDCWWEPYPVPDGVVPDRPGGVSPEAQMYWELCLNEFGLEYVGPGGAQWFEPGEVALPTPEQVATTLRVEIAALLKDPVVDTDPPEGEPSILTIPTFVAVSNWQGEVGTSGCDPTGTICVAITATPTLTFGPGEPDARTITCEPGGTRFDLAGPPPDVQAAAEGACAHAYQHRTGDDGWTATVTIAWEVTWEGEGDTGTLSVPDGTDTFEREVDEVQTVNNEVGS